MRFYDAKEKFYTKLVPEEEYGKPITTFTENDWWRDIYLNTIRDENIDPKHKENLKKQKYMMEAEKIIDLVLKPLEENGYRPKVVRNECPEAELSEIGCYDSILVTDDHCNFCIRLDVAFNGFENEDYDFLKKYGSWNEEIKETKQN